MSRRGPFAGRRNKLCWKVLSDTAAQALVTQDVSVGENLRRLREQHGMTIRELAEQSRLAVNTLSLIENGRSSPSVSTLQQLAVALEAPITAFFEGSDKQQAVAYVRNDCRPRANFDQGLLEDLGAGAACQAVEPFAVTLDANASSGYMDIVHTGYEFVYCLEGRIAYTVDGFTYLLEPGDSLLFEAHLPHRWQNLNPTPSKTLMVLCPTDERDQPAERHFLVE